MKSARRSAWLLVCVLTSGVLFPFSALHAGRVAHAADHPVLSVYTYDSLIAAGGLGPEIFPEFEKSCGCSLKVVAIGDGGQLLNRLELDARQGRRSAAVVLGLDQQTWERGKPWLAAWSGWIPAGFTKIPAEFRVADGFLPFDYGYFAFMADRSALRERKLSPPASLEDLLKPEWKRNILLQDPRTSTPGLAFIRFSESARPGFWKAFRGHWLTFAPGWSQAYGLFLKKEAPLVWSYTTSQAYHEEHGDPAGDSRRYEAIVFREGNPIQIEGAALVRGVESSAEELRLARRFLEFLISPGVQSRIPLKNWMYPVLHEAKLPASFTRLPKPVKIIRLPGGVAESEAAIRRWQEATR